MQEMKPEDLARLIGQSATVETGNGERFGGMKIGRLKKQEIGFMNWTVYNAERPAREALHARLRTLDEHRVFSEIAAQMNKDLGYAKCTQAQLALELSMDKGNVSRTVKYLTTRPADATDDPLTQELVRRTPDGFIVNPMFAIIGAHSRSWEIWFRNAPQSLSVSDQEIAAAKRIEGRASMGEKKARYLRDKGEVRAKRKPPRLELVA